MRPILLASLFVLVPSTVLADDSLVGQPAPDFAGARIFHEDGKRKLSDYKGEVVLVVFFCTICKTQWIEGPVEGLMEKYGARGLAVLGYLGGETEINDQTAGKAREYVREMDFAVFFGADLSAPGTVEPFQAYRAGKRPHCFLINADGNVAWSGTPGTVSIPEPEIEKLLAARAAGIASRHPDAPGALLEALRAGRTAKAYELAMRAGLEPLAAELGGGARKRLARANALHEARDYAAALAIYQTLASSWRD
ncbi:MAG: redoxin domain-containing protein, partial [Planctomycetes bacterium]|nr:redoxin domain-containing protein [Planctomycetota bacterium]